MTTQTDDIAPNDDGPTRIDGEGRDWKKLCSVIGPVPSGIRKLDEMFCGCLESGAVFTPIMHELERAELSAYDANAGIVAALCDYLGLTEHGTTIRCSWLTDDGRESLQFLRTHGVDWRDLADDEDLIDRVQAFNRFIDTVDAIRAKKEGPC